MSNTDIKKDNLQLVYRYRRLYGFGELNYLPENHPLYQKAKHIANGGNPYRVEFSYVFLFEDKFIKENKLPTKKEFQDYLDQKKFQIHEI